MRTTFFTLAILFAGVPGVSKATEVDPPTQEETSLQPIPGQPVTIKIFQLKNADARNLSRVITQILGNRVTSVSVDDRTNSLIIAADKDTLELARALITKLDEPAKPKK